MLRIITGISLSLFVITSLNGEPNKYLHVPFSQQIPSDEWRRGDFNLIEGVTVRRIEFQGNTTTPDKVLRRAFSVKEGDTFSRKGLDRSLRRLNRLGLFERITEGDISWRTDEVIFLSPEVDLIVRVKERRQK